MSTTGQPPRVDCFICRSTRRILSPDDMRVSFPDEILQELGFSFVEGKFRGLLKFSPLYQQAYAHFVEASVSDFPSPRSPPELSLITSTSARALVAMALGGYLVALHGTGQILSHSHELSRVSLPGKEQRMKAALIFKVRYRLLPAGTQPAAALTERPSFPICVGFLWQCSLSETAQSKIV